MRTTLAARLGQLRAPQWRALCLAVTCAAPSVHAAPEGVSSGSCEVVVAGIMRTSDYLYRYEGGCKGGVAEGQGTASWQLRHAPDAPPTTWRGRFSQGVFLENKNTVGARRVDNTRVLLDMGPLPAPKGAQPGRLWVESRVDGKLPAPACQPLGLQVSANGNLADDALAKDWLDRAYAHWQSLCPDGAAGSIKGGFLRVSLQRGSDWSPDSNGNIPGGVVQATKQLRKQPPEWTSYRNEASQQQARLQQDQQEAKDLQANRDRIQTFARKTGAGQLVSLEALEKNPFRFDKQIILVAVRMAAARTATEAVVQPARGTRGDWSRVLLRGAISEWDEQGRVAAVRVNGRSTDKATEDAVVLELVDSQRCNAPNCEDFLLMPGRQWLLDEKFSAFTLTGNVRLALNRP